MLPLSRGQELCWTDATYLLLDWQVDYWCKNKLFVGSVSGFHAWFLFIYWGSKTNSFSATETFTKSSTANDVRIIKKKSWSSAFTSKSRASKKNGLDHLFKASGALTRSKHHLSNMQSKFILQQNFSSVLMRAEILCVVTVWIKKLDDDVFVMTTGTYAPIYQELTEGKTQ